MVYLSSIVMYNPQSSHLLRTSSRVICLLKRCIHDTAAAGFTSAGVDQYNHGRMDYSEESIHQVAKIVRAHHHKSADNDTPLLVELGAGTGKFTQPFVQFCSNKSEKFNFTPFEKFKYLATEPSQFVEYLRENAPNNVQVKFGTGSNIPAESHTVDAIVCGQAFHWMDTPSTVIETHRVLKKKKPLVLIWNGFDYESAPWYKQIDEEIIQPAYHTTNTPRYQSGNWKRCFSAPETEGMYDDIQYWHHCSSHTGTFQIVYDRVFSTSVIAMKTEEQKQQVRQHLTNILETHCSLEKERATGRISIPYITEIAWAVTK